MGVPEDNGEFLIISCPAVNVENAIRDAVSITVLKADMRDIIHGNYKAWVVAPNKVLVKMPTLPYGLANQSDEYFENLNDNVPDNTPAIIQHHTAAVRAIQNDANRKSKLVMLVFPEDVEIDNAVFSHVRAAIITQRFTSFYGYEVIKGEEYPIAQTNIQWKICFHDAELRRLDQVQDDLDVDAIGEALARGMNLRNA